MRLFILSVLFSAISLCSFAQSSQRTTLQGCIVDSVSQAPLSFISVRFDKSTIGTVTDSTGHFSISNRIMKNEVVISAMGYKTKSIIIPNRRTTKMNILLQPENVVLNEILVKPGKEKYSKKNNPAVDLIEKVIAKKEENDIASRNYYQCREYQRIMFALNNFKPDQPQFKRFPFFKKYIAASAINNKVIFPFSMREKIADIYYRKEPKTTKKVIDGYHIEGIDKFVNTEAIDAAIKEVMDDISIYDNSILFLEHKFVGPLSPSMSTNFYKWYLDSDTVVIDNQPCVRLDFAPFNSMDTGFTGNLYIATDGSYGIKRAKLYTPTKINVNFVEKLVLEHDFKEVSPNCWIPTEKRISVDLSLVNAIKLYADRVETFDNYIFDKPASSNIYNTSTPEITNEGYLKRTSDYWVDHRPSNHSHDYGIEQMMKEMNRHFFFKALLGLGKYVSNGYINTAKDMDKNKLDIGTIPTFYSHNPIEGNRFRVTLATTKNLFPHLFLYGYGAYGTKDERFKYCGEATWAFNHPKYHKDEFPKNNLTLSYKNDMTDLGEQYSQAERDNILMSLRSTKNIKLTYSQQWQLSYEREYYNHFSYRISAMNLDEQPAGNLAFYRQEGAQKMLLPRLKTTEIGVSLRYAPFERFVQLRRHRYQMPAENLIINFNYNQGLKNILGGGYNYQHLSLNVSKDFWIPAYGRINISATGDKVFGKAPYPFLVSPSSNSSFTIQAGSFYLLEPMEFIHDTQLLGEVNYHLDGWLLNRIPLIKKLKWRSLLGVRGFYGTLSKRNNPQYDNSLIMFPENSYTTSGHIPYAEFNVGIENIFRFFRIDYVRRLTYMNHPNTRKDGVRVTFELNF